MSLCFFKQKTAYEMRISDWSSDVCSSDLQYVQAAKFADGALDHRFDLFLDPDIGGDADGLRAELVADFRCHLFGRRAVAASDQQAGAFARHAPRYAMAQALRAAGDNADLAFKQLRSLSSLLVWSLRLRSSSTRSCHFSRVMTSTCTVPSPSRPRFFSSDSSSSHLSPIPMTPCPAGTQQP